MLFNCLENIDSDIITWVFNVIGQVSIYLIHKLYPATVQECNFFH